jgi:REP-associated tyrosine transposase
MARKLRIQYPGAIYHCMSRGNHRSDIVRGDEDRELFLDTLAEACGKTDWQIHAWCLMRNHFHLVVETPRGNLVEGMKWLLGTYTGRFNRRHRLFGHLFSGRYKALFVDGDGDGYLKTVCDYVHLNPARAGLLRPGETMAQYRWSSLGEYCKPPRSRGRWMRVDRLFGEWGIPKDSEAGREEFERRMEARRAAEDAGEFKPLLRGWCHGSDEFRQELLERMSAGAGPEHYGVEIRESGQAKAERMMGEELKRAGWSEADLYESRKGDATKLKIALRLRKESTMTLSWIAARLRMGSKTHLSHLLYWHARERGGRRGTT